MWFDRLNISLCIQMNNFLRNISLKYRKCPNRLNTWHFGNFYDFTWRQVYCFKNAGTVFHLRLSLSAQYDMSKQSHHSPTPTGQIPRGTTASVYTIYTYITTTPQTKVKTYQGFFLFKLNSSFLSKNQRLHTGWERTLAPLPQPQLQTSQKIYKSSLEIALMSDFCAKFHEPELIFTPWKFLFQWACQKSENQAKILIFLTKRTKIPTPLTKIVRKNLIYYQSSLVIS